MKPVRCCHCKCTGEGTGIFGYAKPLEQELKVKEQQCYKAYYCGVCREIGRNFGFVPRFGLTHEFAVLAMLLDVCSGQNHHLIIRNKPCIAHPLRRIRSVSGSPYITYAAACNVLFFRAKLQDAWIDDRNIGAWIAGVLYTLGNHKAGKRYKTFAQLICNEIATLTKLEREACSSVDAVSEPFAKLLSTLFTIDGLMPGGVSKELATMGYHLGKWIYLIDAATDREEDRKNGNYNVYNIRYRDEMLPERERMTRELCLASIAESWEQIKKKISQNRNAEIGYLDNLFYLGLRAREESLLCAGQEEAL